MATNFYGMSGSATTIATAVDISGNTYYAGNFTSVSISVNGLSSTRIGTQDGFVLKLDSSGTAVWLKSFGGTGVSMAPNGVVVDSGGNVTISGYFSGGSLTTPAVTIIGSQDAFMIQVDSSGATTWSQNFGGSGALVYAQSIAVDGSGSLYLGGYFSSASLTTPALTKTGSTDAFTFKLSSGGALTWYKNFGGSGASCIGNSVAVDVSGSVYLGGYFSSSNLTNPALTLVGFGDAFAFKLDSTGTPTWARGYSGSLVFTVGQSIAVDVSGNVYLSGTFNGNNLTTPALTKIGTTDVFAIKINPSGGTTWYKNYGGSGVSMTGGGLAVDVSGSVYLGGYFSGASLTTPAITKLGTVDAFAFKLDSSGTTTWYKNYGGLGTSMNIFSLAVDSVLNVYLGGSFQSASTTTPVMNKLGTKDGFSLKLDSSGTTTWSKNYNGQLNLSGSINMRNAVGDSSGNTYVLGSFSSAKAVIGGVSLSIIGAQDAFVAKVNSSGTVLWAKSFGGAGVTTTATTVASDTSGNAYFAGFFAGGDLTTPALTKMGNADALVVKLDSSGNTTWAKNYGGGASASAYGRAVATDISGNVYLGGSFQGASLTTPALTKIGGSDAFAFKLDSTGAMTWYKNYGGSSGSVTATVYAIAADISGNVYLGGNFTNSNLTTPAITKLGTSDAFAFKLDSSGGTTWYKNYGGAGTTAAAYTIAADISGNVYLGGYFSGSNLTTPTITKIGTQDAFAFKLDSSGGTTWYKNYGGAGASVFGQYIAIDGSANVYLSGYYSGASLTTPALTKIGTQDAFAFRLDSSGTTTWSKSIGGAGATTAQYGGGIDANGNINLAGTFTASLTTPPLTKQATADGFVMKAQVFNDSCSPAGKFKYDSTNNVMVFCDGTNWQSMHNASAATCTGTTTGKTEYYSNGASSDFVWYGGSCKSAKGTETYGACTVDGKIDWDSGNSTLRGCVNGTWTTLKGW